MKHKILWDFEIQTDHIISVRQDLVIVNKKRTCRIVDVALLTHHRVKLKENEKREKNIKLAGGPKKLWNMKVMVIPIVIGALGRFINRLVQGLEKRERVEAIQTTAFLRLTRILRRVLKT